MQKISLDDLRKRFDSESIDILAAKDGVDGFAVYECADMCSSRFGESVAVAFGPSCTIQSVDELPKFIDRQLASTQKMLKAVCEL